MPFTGSHPAAVLPLVRSGLPASALVIGSMSPDLPFYLPSPVTATFTHTVLGATTVDIVLGAAIFAGWQSFVGGAMVAYAPTAVRARLGTGVPAGLPYHCGRPRRILGVLAALLVGALTHVGWDSFTHATMWGPVHIRWLAGRVGPLPAYEWAQYASGLAGALALILWCWNWWRHTSPAARPVPEAGRGRRLMWIIAALAGGAGVVFGAVDGVGQSHPVRGALFKAATTAVSAVAAVVLVTAASWRLHDRPKAATQTRSTGRTSASAGRGGGSTRG